MTYNLAMLTISASDARRTLPEQLDRVEQGERVSITRHGRVVAVLVSPEVVANRPAAFKHAELLADKLRAARHRPLPEPTIARARAEELVTTVDAERAGR